MISLANAALKIYVALEPCDMRKGFNGLYASASQHLRERRLGVDQLFVFANKRRDRIKLLYFDGTGVLGGQATFRGVLGGQATFRDRGIPCRASILG